MLPVYRWQGSVHDSTIFTQSLISTRLQNGEFGMSYLLGDAGCACKSFLLRDAGCVCKSFLLTAIAATTTPAEVRCNPSSPPSQQPHQSK